MSLILLQSSVKQLYCFTLICQFWLFEKALASERELIIALLDPDAMTDTGPIAHRLSGNTDTDSLKTEPAITFVLDRIFEGACRPFKVRVEQVLQSQPSLVVSYKLSNTLEFYSSTVSLICMSSFTKFNVSRVLHTLFLL